MKRTILALVLLAGAAVVLGLYAITDPARAAAQPVAQALLGDVNRDGVVNGIDLAIFAQNFGLEGCGNIADLRGDCVVNGVDLAIFAQNFGRMAATPTPSSEGTLIVCKALTSITGGQQFEFTVAPVVHPPSMRQTLVFGGQLGPVCTSGVLVPPGSVSIAEVLPAGFTLNSVTLNGVPTTPSGNQVTTTISAGQTTTVTFINSPP